jgi:hypothetical protein
MRATRPDKLNDFPSSSANIKLRNNADICNTNLDLTMGDFNHRLNFDQGKKNEIQRHNS